MSYSWLNKYIGVPYVPGGRDMDGADCYGLVKMIYRDGLGLDLPDWETDEIDLRRFHETIVGVVTSGTFTEVEPEDYAFAVCYRAKIAHHIGLVFKDGVMHTMSQGEKGAVFEPLPRFLSQYGHVVFGRWEP